MIALVLTLSLAALAAYGLWNIFKPIEAAGRLQSVDQREQEAIRNRTETLAAIGELEEQGYYTHDEAERERQEVYRIWNKLFEDYRALREVYWQCR